MWETKTSKKHNKNSYSQILQILSRNLVDSLRNGRKRMLLRQHKKGLPWQEFSFLGLSKSYNWQRATMIQKNQTFMLLLWKNSNNFRTTKKNKIQKLMPICICSFVSLCIFPRILISILFICIRVVSKIPPQPCLIMSWLFIFMKAPNSLWLQHHDVFQ